MTNEQSQASKFQGQLPVTNFFPLSPTSRLFPAKDQVFKHKSLWRSFHIQTTILPSIMGLIREDKVY